MKNVSPHGLQLFYKLFTLFQRTIWSIFNFCCTNVLLMSGDENVNKQGVKSQRRKLHKEFERREMWTGNLRTARRSLSRLCVPSNILLLRSTQWLCSTEIYFTMNTIRMLLWAGETCHTLAFKLWLNTW